MTTPSNPGGQAMHVAGTAADEARQAADVAKDEAGRLAGTAAEEAKNVVEESRQQAMNLVDEALSQVNEQAGSQRDRMVELLRTFGDDVEKMVSGERVESGLAHDLARQLADRTRELSGRMDGREPTELLDEVRSFARRKPGTFLVGALAAGVIAGRVTRGAKAASSQDSTASPAPVSTPSSTGTAAGQPTAGLGTPASPPAYPDGSGLGEPGTTMDQPLSPGLGGTPGDPR